MTVTSRPTVTLFALTFAAAALAGTPPAAPDGGGACGYGSARRLERA